MMHGDPITNKVLCMSQLFSNSKPMGTCQDFGKLKWGHIYGKHDLTLCVFELVQDFLKFFKFCDYHKGRAKIKVLR